MCSFELDDPCEVFIVSHPKARVHRRCKCCSAVISPGEVYERENYVNDGTAGTGWGCVWCALAREVFSADPHHRGAPTFDWFKSALRDCFDGAAKRDADAKVWRDLYAGILRRWRAAPEVMP